MSFDNRTDCDGADGFDARRTLAAPSVLERILMEYEIEGSYIPFLCVRDEMYAALVTESGIDDCEFLCLSTNKDCCRVACKLDAEERGGLIEPCELGEKLARSADGSAIYAVSSVTNIDNGPIVLELKQVFNNWV